MTTRTALSSSTSANKDTNHLSQQLAKLQARFADCDAQRIAHARKLGDVETELRLSHQREAKLKASLDKARDSAPQQSNRELNAKLVELTRLHQEAKDKHRSAMAKMEKQHEEEERAMRQELEEARRRMEEEGERADEAEERAEMVSAQLRATTRAAQEIGERLVRVEEEKRDLAFELQLERRCRGATTSTSSADDSYVLLWEQIQELQQQAQRDAQMLQASEETIVALLQSQDQLDDTSYPSTLPLIDDSSTGTAEPTMTDLQANLDLALSRLSQSQQDLSTLHDSYLALLSSSKQHDHLVNRIATLETACQRTQNEHEATLKNLAETQQRLQASRADGSTLRSQLAELRATQRSQLEATKASQHEVAMTRTRLSHLEETNADLLAALQHAVPFEESYHTVLSQAKVTIARLQACEEQLEQLAEENLALASHENGAQKILYLDGVRRQLVEAKARVGELECEVGEERRRRQGVEGELKALKGIGAMGASQNLSASVGGGRVRRVASSTVAA